jgi:hypothetical protein
VNEKPKLITSNYYAFVNDSTGAVIGKILLTDEDNGQNYLYSIKSQSVENILNIDPSTGELTLVDNEAIQSLVSQIVTFTVKVSDNGSPVLSDEREFTLEILNKPDLVKVNYAMFKNNLEVYPNPASNEIMIILPDQNEIQVLNMIDTRGNIVYSRKIISSPVKIETSDLLNGIYYIQVISDNRVLSIHKVAIIK